MTLFNTMGEGTVKEELYERAADDLEFGTEVVRSIQLLAMDEEPGLTRYYDKIAEVAFAATDPAPPPRPSLFWLKVASIGVAVAAVAAAVTIRYRLK